MNDEYFKRVAEEHLGSPRIHMFFILNICGLVGFLTSYILVRHLDVTAMWLRYGLGAMAAYAAFFILLKFWIAFFIRGERPDAKVISAKRIKKAWKNIKHVRRMKLFKNKGGSYSHASAGSSFDAGDLLDGKDKDGFIVIVLVVVLASILIIAGMFIFAAPVFWGEVIGAALLGSGGMKRMKAIPQEEWYETAFRRSRLHFLGLVLILVIGGGFLQWAAPGAVTIGDVLRILLAE